MEKKFEKDIAELKTDMNFLIWDTNLENNKKKCLKIVWYGMLGLV